jgi:stearoyl-CoA desaturase (delta-9 desaturase)
LYIPHVRIYNAVGVGTLVLQGCLGALLAPPWLTPLQGAAIALAVLAVSWFVCGVYLSDIIHMGIAHRALDYRPWFIQTVTLVNNTLGIYVDPVSWVRRHRLHHGFSDHAGDPNKLASDGFWRTLWLCVFPYSCQTDTATDPILESWPFRLVSHPLFTYLSPVVSIGVLWLLVRDWKYAVGVWFGVRIFALWVNMVQNYWTHDRRFGTRRYEDADDNAMNIGEWFPVTATFSACWQNNHHHHPGFMRTTHDPAEYDFGLATVKVMGKLGLVRPSATGQVRPEGLALGEIGL